MTYEKHRPPQTKLGKREVSSKRFYGGFARLFSPPSAPHAPLTRQSLANALKPSRSLMNSSYPAGSRPSSSQHSRTVRSTDQPRARSAPRAIRNRSITALSTASPGAAAAPTERDPMRSTPAVLGVLGDSTARR